jgi:hypothetical protein
MKKKVQEKNTFEKKKHRVSSGFVRVDRVLPGSCTDRSFNKFRLVQPPNRTTGPGLISVPNTAPKLLMFMESWKQGTLSSNI